MVPSKTTQYVYAYLIRLFAVYEDTKKPCQQNIHARISLGPTDRGTLFPYSSIGVRPISDVYHIRDLCSVSPAIRHMYIRLPADTSEFINSFSRIDRTI